MPTQPRATKPRPGREVVPGHGILIPGHGDPDAAEADVLAWLDERVTDRWRKRELRQRITQNPTSIVRAYWAGPTLGFCTAEHPDAEAVTVVSLPDDVTAAG